MLRADRPGGGLAAGPRPPSAGAAPAGEGSPATACGGHRAPSERLGRNWAQTLLAGEGSGRGDGPHGTGAGGGVGSRAAPEAAMSAGARKPPCRNPPPPRRSVRAPHPAAPRGLQAAPTHLSRRIRRCPAVCDPAAGKTPSPPCPRSAPPRAHPSSPRLLIRPPAEEPGWPPRALPFPTGAAGGRAGGRPPLEASPPHCPASAAPPVPGDIGGRGGPGQGRPAGAGGYGTDTGEKAQGRCPVPVCGDEP